MMIDNLHPYSVHPTATPAPKFAGVEPDISHGATKWFTHWSTLVTWQVYIQYSLDDEGAGILAGILVLE